MMRKHSAFMSALLLVFLGTLFSPAFAQNLPENFDKWVQSAQKDWKIPGMAIGIVKDGEVIYAKGFGEKELDSGEAVDANTILVLHL